MPADMQRRFRERSSSRRLWVGGRVATHQDLSAFFVARAIELYLREGGRFAFVMPRAVLSRAQFEGFRQGDFTGPTEGCAVAFDVPWDLGAVDPIPFPVPSCVVLGRRTAKSLASSLPERQLSYAGNVGPQLSWNEATAGLTIETSSLPAAPVAPVPVSKYASAFRNGATLFPRMLVFVVDAQDDALGTPSFLRSVKSRRSSLDKPPWSRLPDLTGRVEEIFVRPTYLGENVLPFRLAQPSEAVIPFDDGRLLSGSDPRIDRYRGLADWWRRAEDIWKTHRRPASTRSLLDQVDYMHKLGQQFPTPDIRVVYTASGNNLAAAILIDRRAVVEHALYWARALSMEEAHYLSAVLNSQVVADSVRPLQSTGAFGPRHFDKYVWRLPIPLFDPEDSLHTDLAALGAKAADVAGAVALPPGAGFQRARRIIREALRASDVGQEIENRVTRLLS